MREREINLKRHLFDAWSLYYWTGVVALKTCSQYGRQRKEKSGAGAGRREDKVRSLRQRVNGKVVGHEPYRFTGETGVSASSIVGLRIPRFHRKRATFTSVG